MSATHDNGAYDKLQVAVKEAVLRVWDSPEFDTVGDSEGAQMVADAALVVVAQRLQELPVSRNDLGITAWVQWLDIADLFAGRGGTRNEG